MSRRNSSRSAGPAESDSDAPRSVATSSSAAAATQLSRRDSPLPRTSAAQHNERTSSRALQQQQQQQHQSNHDGSLQSEEEHNAEVSLVARVVASLVLKWKGYVESQQREHLSSLPVRSSSPSASSPSSRAMVVDGAGAARQPPTRWITRLNAWETAERDRLERAQRASAAPPTVPHHPLPVDILEGLVDSAGVVLRGMEGLDREQHRRAAQIEQLEAELDSAKRENKQLRARLRTNPRGEDDEAEEGVPTSTSRTTERRGSGSGRRTRSPAAHVDPVLARMITEATRATLNEHFLAPRHSPKRAAIAIPAGRKPPLAGAVPIAVPTASIPAAPYAQTPPKTSRAASPEVVAVVDAAAGLYTPPSALRGAGSREGSSTILSPLTEVYSLSDPQSSHRKPSRSPLRDTAPKDGERANEKAAAEAAHHSELAELAVAAAARVAAVEAQHEEQLRELREAYDAELGAVAEAQRRLNALSSTVDVLRAQLALADGQRELEMEEARLCTLAQQTLIDEEEAERLTLMLDSFAARQAQTQAWMRAATATSLVSASPSSTTSAPRAASLVVPNDSRAAASSSGVLTGIPFTAAAVGTGKRIQFTPASASASVAPHSAVLFSRDRAVDAKQPPTATTTTTTATKTTTADVIKPVVEISSAQPRSASSSLSSLSDTDVRVPASQPAKSLAAPARVSSGLPARRLPARPHAAAPATAPATSSSSPTPIVLLNQARTPSTSADRAMAAVTAALSPRQPSEEQGRARTQVSSTAAQTSPIVRRQQGRSPRPESESDAQNNTRSHVASTLLTAAPHEVDETAHFLASEHDPQAMTFPYPEQEQQQQQQQLISPSRAPAHAAIDSPVREVQTPDESPVQWWTPGSTSPSARRQPPPPPGPLPSSHPPGVAYDLYADGHEEEEGELKWQRAKQAALVAGLRRESQSRRQSLGSGASAVTTTATYPRGPLSSSPDRERSGRAVAGVVLSPSPHAAQRGVQRPSDAATARLLLDELTAEAGTHTSPPSRPVASSNAIKPGVSRAPVAAEYLRRFSPNRSQSSASASPSQSATASPSRPALRDQQQQQRPSSMSPPAERTPKSISRFYAEQLEAPEVAIAAPAAHMPLPHTNPQHKVDDEVASGEASPPPRAPPTASLLSASALASRTLPAPRFELPGLGCVLEATVPTAVELRVTEVREDSPAKQAGVKKGDMAVPLN